jgi:hypothetical protein
MTLRKKKQGPPPTDKTAPSSTPEEHSASAQETNLRPSQRIPLPHGSLFVLDQTTNTHWLHSIRADKRPISEKSPEELAFNTERISLTFRHIGTFINTVTQTIWGQGATGKTREAAKPILQGEEAEREGERMIRAFGIENHSSSMWNWDEWYGDGFDAVNFESHEIPVLPGEIGQKDAG